MPTFRIPGATALLVAGIAFVCRGDATNAARLDPIVAAPAAGHLVLVVEGDRDRLAVTFARRKPDPWAGVPKGFTSDWRLSIRDADGAELAGVALDLSAFDLRPEQKGRPLGVRGCIVSDPRVSMLVNAPSHADADHYVFLRGDTVVGGFDAAALDRLIAGGR